MKLHEMLERRARLVAECRQLIDAANGSDLADEARKKFDANEGEIRKLDGRITEERKLAEWERQASADTINGGTPDFERECRSPGLFLDAVAASAGVHGRDTGRVLEVSAEMQRRTGRAAQGIMLPSEVFERRVVVSATSGAGAIGTDHRGDLMINALRAASIVDRLGATVLSGLQGNVSIPAVDTGFTSAWIAENGALSAVDWDINSRNLTPHHVGALTEFGRNLVLQADPSVDAMTTRDASRALAAALDSAALIGGGANQPDGIITQLAAGPGLGTWATPTWAEGLALIAAVEADDAAEGSLGWALHPSVRKKLRSTLVAASTDSRMIMSEPNSLYGYSAFASTGLTLGSPAAGPAIFGDFSSLVVGYWSGVDVLANPYETTAYSKGNIQVRCLLSADVAIRHIESFQAVMDMPTA